MRYGYRGAGDMDRRELIKRGPMALLGIIGTAITAKASDSVEPKQIIAIIRLKPNALGGDRDDFMYRSALKTFGKESADHLAKSFRWQVSTTVRQ